MYVARLLLASALLWLSGAAMPQQTQHLNIRQFITAQEFRDAGLEKLSPQEMQALERWFNRYTQQVMRAPQGGAASSSTARGGTGYLIESAVNDETFIINGNVYKAKTYCMRLSKGDRVVFAEGSALGACVTAKLVNTRNGDVCNVWCE